MDTTIDKEIDLCAIRAQYWIAMATTKACLNMNLFHGTDGPPFTDEEKVQHCMEISNRHIQLMANLVEAKKDILYKSKERS